MADIPAPSLSFISPSDSSKSNALASFVVSFGTATVAPFLRSSSDFVLPAYNPNGSKCTDPAETICVLFSLLKSSNHLKNKSTLDGRNWHLILHLLMLY